MKLPNSRTAIRFSIKRIYHYVVCVFKISYQKDKVYVCKVDVFGFIFR